MLQQRLVEAAQGLDAVGRDPDGGAARLPDAPGDTLGLVPHQVSDDHLGAFPGEQESSGFAGTGYCP